MARLFDVWVSCIVPVCIRFCRQRCLRAFKVISMRSEYVRFARAYSNVAVAAYSKPRTPAHKIRLPFSVPLALTHHRPNPPQLLFTPALLSDPP